MKIYNISFVLVLFDVYSSPRNWLLESIREDLKNGEEITNFSVLQYENEETEFTYKVDLSLSINDHSAYHAELIRHIEDELVDGEKILCFQCVELS